MNAKILKDAILNNEAHEERKQAKADKAKSERAERKRRVKARSEANSKTAFNQLPAEEKQRYSELVRMVPDGHGYTAFQRIDALFAYLIEGTVRRAAKLVGISAGTMLGWSQNSWWKGALEKIREIKQDELDTQYTRIIDRTINEISDRIDNGDERLDKNGKPVRVKISGKDLMLINAMAYDKRNLVRGKANNITEKVITIQDRNQILATQFRKIGHEGLVLDGEFQEEEQEDG
jgi:hypothetical protein